LPPLPQPAPTLALQAGGTTDYLTVNQTGDLTFVDADGAASITGPAGGGLSLLSSANQALTLNAAGGDAAGEDLIITANNLSLLATGALSITPDAALTTAIDLTDTDLTNALSIGANNIIGTTANIDLTHFDVAGSTGNITVSPGQGLDTNAAGEIRLGYTTATTVSLGTTAATTLNIGAGGSLTRTLNIGTGTGADTINIGTGNTVADDINLGGLATSTIDILGVTRLGDGGSANYLSVSATGNLTFTGSADTINKTSGTLNLNTVDNQAITTGTGLFTVSGNQAILNQGELRLYDGASYYTGFKAPADLTGTSNYVYTLPVDYGTNGYVLSSNGSGSLSWIPVTTGDPPIMMLTGEQIHPKNALWHDILVGGTATGTATIALQAETGNIKATSLNLGTNYLSLSGNTLGISTDTNLLTLTNDLLSVSGNLALSANSYLNFGSTIGTDGYGFRDNSGTIEFKNNAGTWTSLTSLINATNNDYWQLNDGALSPLLHHRRPAYRCHFYHLGCFPGCRYTHYHRRSG
jgi:hypothetical protein